MHKFIFSVQLLVVAVFLVVTPFNASAALDADLLHGLAARSIGPAAVSGRITAIDAMNSNPNHIVIGAATGEVWISDNGGVTWNPVFDDQPAASIGAVAIDRANPDVTWVGTGEGNVRNSTSIGAGMFKSIDGGKTWKRILHGDERTGGTDVKLDPFNPEKVYASLWEFRRWPYFFESGGKGSGMHISWDGGESWTRKTEDDGLPAGDLRRISIAPSAAQQGRVYALLTGTAPIGR